MTNPTVSIIVPNYNHEAFLPKRLESIFSQTYQDFEVILLDDKSSDSSLEILKKYAGHSKVSHFIRNENNSGSPFLQWEKGINLAKGDFIWIAESDDYSENTFLSRTLEVIKSWEDLALVYCQSYSVNGKDEIVGSWLNHTNEFDENMFRKDFIMNGNVFIENFLMHKNVIPNVSAVLFKKKALNNILPLEISACLKYNADWYYYIQLLSKSKVAFIADPLNYFRIHSNSVIATADNKNSRIEILKMELQGRNKMIDFIGRSNPDNFKEIKRKKSYGDDHRYYILIEDRYRQGGIIEAARAVIFKPKMLKQFLKFLKTK